MVCGDMVHVGVGVYQNMYVLRCEPPGAQASLDLFPIAHKSRVHDDVLAVGLYQGNR